ncbi:hypothetical protein ABEV74_20550 [Paenibacillus cisolokensis]|uniref:hypothetical protein n=1 Tax=Paenibacillus cisolokensis TaxID=1658519 RepID=UPI003D2C8963
MINKQAKLIDGHKLLEWIARMSLMYHEHGYDNHLYALNAVTEEIKSGRFDAPTDDRLRAAFSSRGVFNALRYYQKQGLCEGEEYDEIEKALEAISISTGAQNVPHVELDDLPFTRHACGDVGCPVCGRAGRLVFG